jgi:hypothetical protein
MRLMEAPQPRGKGPAVAQQGVRPRRPRPAVAAAAVAARCFLSPEEIRNKGIEIN